MNFSKITSALVAAGVALIATQALADDPVKGKKIAKKCKSCHTMKEGGKNGLGPNLYGVLGRKAGTVEGFKYSKAMLESGITWDNATFNDFIAKPKKLIPKTKMSFKGVKKASQREDLIAYFETLGKTEMAGKMPAGSIADGEKAVKKYCVVCHTFEQGGKVVFGPNLFGIAGQPAASVAGFGYSDALAASGLTWTDTNLISFLSDPEGFLPGTTARFPGLKDAKAKSDILAYVKSLQ